MSPDEIFILLLVALFVGAIAAVAIHSRRRGNAQHVGSQPDNAAAAPHESISDEPPQSREPSVKLR